MKKFIILISLIVFTGCSKKIELPKNSTILDNKENYNASISVLAEENKSIIIDKNNQNYNVDYNGEAYVVRNNIVYKAKNNSLSKTLSKNNELKEANIKFNFLNMNEFLQPLKSIKIDTEILEDNITTYKGTVNSDGMTFIFYNLNIKKPKDKSINVEVKYSNILKEIYNVKYIYDKDKTIEVNLLKR